MARNQLFQLFDHDPAARFRAVAVDHDRQRVHRLVIHQDRHLDQEILAVFADLVVKAGIALGHRFQPVVEVEDDLGQGQVIDDHRAGTGIGQIQLDAAPVLAQFQNVAQVIVGHHDRGLDARLLDMVDQGQVGHVGGVVQFAHLAVAHVQPENDAGRGGDQVQIIFAFQPVADHLQVQQPQKAAAEAEAKRGRSLHFGAEAGVVQGQFLDRVAQRLEIVRIDRKQPAEHHRLRGFETRQGGGGGLFLVRDRIADTGVANLLDGCGENADLARPQFRDVLHRRRQHRQLVQPVGGAGLHHLDLIALADGAVHDPDHHDDAQIAVIPGIDQHRLQGRVGISRRRGQALHDRLQHIRDAEAGLGADRDRLAGVDADHVLDLRLDAIGLGGGQVDLVQDRDDLVIGVDGLIDIGQCLRLDPLGRVHDQQRSFDGAHGPADLVGEIDMARRVDQVQDIGLAVLRRIGDADRIGLDGDAAFALDIHGVQHLGLHVAFGDGAGQLDQPVGQRGFAVVDMGHDREIADQGQLGHGAAIQGRHAREKRISQGRWRGCRRPGFPSFSLAARRCRRGSGARRDSAAPRATSYSRPRRQ